MGKGDQRSRKGKRNRGSYGKSRPHRKQGAKKGAGRKGAPVRRKR